MDSNRDEGNNQRQNSREDAQDAANSGANAARKAGSGLLLVDLLATGGSSCALVAGEAAACACLDFHGGSSKAGDGEGEEGNELGELHFDDLRANVQDE